MSQFGNQQVSQIQLKKIRALDDFDLIMLISEINDYGWPVAAVTLEVMVNAANRSEQVE